MTKDKTCTYFLTDPSVTSCNRCIHCGIRIDLHPIPRKMAKKYRVIELLDKDGTVFVPQERVKVFLFIKMWRSFTKGKRYDYKRRNFVEAIDYVKYSTGTYIPYKEIGIVGWDKTTKKHIKIR